MSKNGTALTAEEIAEIKAKAAAEVMEAEKAAIREKIAAEVKAELEAKAAAEVAAVAEKERAEEGSNAKRFDAEAKRAGDKLKGFKTVRVKVPVDPQNPKLKTATVVINGYKYVVRRGETVDVPEPVADLLEQGGYI